MCVALVFLFSLSLSLVLRIQFAPFQIAAVETGSGGWCGGWHTHTHTSPSAVSANVIKICDISFLSLLKNFILGILCTTQHPAPRTTHPYSPLNFSAFCSLLCVRFLFYLQWQFLCFKQAAHCFLYAKLDWRFERARLAAIWIDLGLGHSVLKAMIR